ncbi:hypothetical protein SBFV3_gp10 [Sulfolobales Beppu filamentous virus 3]|uniref:Uncharacterized protein n=1 Tax=Sulfolobales Beppu filamentous virus 3 TaxID=2493124 RepID=A0A3S8NF32_9VIRU|nr:hypothetical protein HOU83_gp10 [Sulfolobales Beppu filamentous virus 3]AZI75845.1 hypothetical protein SBFV3_gp10 [Sulfolobales Beppu filamentous virus 3]
MSIPKKKPIQEEEQGEQEVDVNDWEEVEVSTPAFKLSPKEWCIVKVLDMPKPIKNGQSFVVNVEVIKWNGENPPKEGEKVAMILQKLLYNAVDQAIKKYGVPVLIYAKNLGKEKGKNYYTFEVRAKPVQGEGDKQ